MVNLERAIPTQQLRSVVRNLKGMFCVKSENQIAKKWVVCPVNSLGGRIACKYDNLDQATDAAWQLALKNNNSYFVFEAVGVVHPPTFTHDMLREL